MAIKRFSASKTNTITNAFQANLTTRGTGSNMGDADVMEVFSIYGQASTASSELSRVLVDFPVLTTISSSRDGGAIPASGSVKFYLKLTDAPHVETTPRQFTLTVAPISRSWTQGTGLDTINYTDLGVSNWISASQGVAWTEAGGDFLTGSGEPTTSQYFVEGTENLEVDITDAIEQQLDETIGAYGFGVFLTASLESATTSYYTKKFFAKESEFFFYRPVLEARWNSSLGDDNNNFFLSSSLADSQDNINTLYFYNVVNGQLKNIPSIGAGQIGLSLHTTSGAPSIALPAGGGVVSNGDTNVTGGWVSTGIYSASMAFTSSTVTTVYPVWFNLSTEEQLLTGSAITVRSRTNNNNYQIPDYYCNVTNLKSSYSNEEDALFRIYTRPRNWHPNIYVVANSEPETTIIEKLYYKIFRVVDNYEVIPYGTGSSQHTLMSYDRSGNYFNLDMSMFESGYMYAMKFSFELNNGVYKEIPQVFKFRVE